MRTKVAFWMLTAGTLSAALIIVACTNLLAKETVTTTGTDIQVAALDISGAELLLIAADRVALQYTTLPTCNGQVVVCSQPAVKSRLKDDARLAKEKLTILRTAPEAARSVLFRDFKKAVEQIIVDTPNMTARTGVAGAPARIGQTDAVTATPVSFEKFRP